MHLTGKIKATGADFILIDVCMMHSGDFSRVPCHTDVPFLSQLCLDRLHKILMCRWFTISDQASLVQARDDAIQEGW